MVDLQEFIREEIQHINDESKKPGWTDWAVLSAFAAALWLLSAEIESGKYSINNVHVLLVMLMLSFDVFSNLKGVFQTINNDTQESRYSTIKPWKSNVYLNSIYSYLYYAILIILILRLPINIPYSSILIALIYSSLCILATTFLLVLVVLEPPLNLSSNKGTYYIFGLGILLPLAPLIHILLLNDWSLMHLMQVDLRIASLILIAFWLINILIPEKTDKFLLIGLVNLKRSHFLGHITEEVAKHQLELLLLGHKVSDFLQPLIYEILSELAILQNLEHERSKLSIRISQITSQKSSETYDTELNDLVEKHLTIDKRFEQSVSKIENTRLVLDKKALWLISANKDSASEIDHLIQQMDQEFRVALDELERLQNSRKINESPKGETSLTKVL